MGSAAAGTGTAPEIPEEFADHTQLGDYRAGMRKGCKRSLQAEDIVS